IDFDHAVGDRVVASAVVVGSVENHGYIVDIDDFKSLDTDDIGPVEHGGIERAATDVAQCIDIGTSGIIRYAIVGKVCAIKPEEVVAILAEEPVGTCTAVQKVDPGSAIERVIAIAAIEGVDTVLAVEGIVT